MADVIPAPDGYYNRVSDDLWWAIFTRDNPRVDYEQNQVRISQMEVNDNGDVKRNTRGKIIAIPGMGREGEEWLTWNRPFMEDLFKDKKVYIPPRNQQTLGDVIEDFNKLWRFQLSPRDFYDQNITITQVPMTVQIVMRPTCLCFQGTLTIIIGTPKKHIGELIINKDLSGLEYPTKQNKKAQGPFYVYERDFTFAGQTLRDDFKYYYKISQDQFDYLVDLFEDKWVLSDQAADWNFKGTTVAYNGVIDNSPVPANRNYTNVLVLQLDNVLCTNITGMLILHYNIAEKA